MAASGGAFSAALKTVTRPEHLATKRLTDTLAGQLEKVGVVLHLEGGIKNNFLRVLSSCHSLRFIALTSSPPVPL